MYTNTTILGENGDDSESFLTADFVGQFTLPTMGSVDFNVCSDDDEFVYVSGGAFGNGTLVVDNGGIHGLSCTSGNENTSMLTDVAAGTYTLSVFYADREQVGAAFQLSSDLDLTPAAWRPRTRFGYAAQPRSCGFGRVGSEAGSPSEARGNRGLTLRIRLRPG